MGLVRGLVAYNTLVGSFSNLQLLIEEECVLL